MATRNGRPAAKALCPTCKKRKAEPGKSCAVCIRNAYRMIESGEATRRQLEDAGVLPPLKKLGRPADNAVRRKLAKVGK